MNLNWLDFILLAILLVTAVLGLIKGLVRQVIGIAAVIGGVVLAGLYYPHPARLLNRFISHEVTCQFLGFLLIFLAALFAGWLVSFLLTKLMIGPLKFLNHLLGGAFGLLKGILICGVIVFAMMVFPVDRKALLKSSLAPHCYGLTKTVVYLIPQELKEKFVEAYENFKTKWDKDGKKI